ncbi:MAG TPA: hypothetical protein VE010_10945, partial [Thermoanaerobaculia bacterium]|nr:hypothetical protein [Thermoanaerobaculia bacterium]
MMKRMMSLLLLAVAVFSVAPIASAQCVRCTFAAPRRCVIATGDLRFQFCFDDGAGNCQADTACTSLVATAALPLAAEYSVATVERLD